MTLPGGPADKLGNRYEKWWVLSEFVRMLRGETEAIRIEDPNLQKADFVVTTGSRRELHQAKRRHYNGKWNLSALGVAFLNNVGDLLANNNDRFVFVSGSDAPELFELCEAANTAESTAEFKRVFLASARRENGFIEMCRWWKCNVPTAIEFLRRIDVRTIGDRELEQKVEWGIKPFFLAKPISVIDSMLGIIEDSVHRTISRNDLVEELTRRGYPPRRLPNPEHATVAVRLATDHYLDSARRKLIRQHLVTREASGTLLSRIAKNATDIVLTGKAGVGKTACVIEVVEGLRERGLPVLAFRFDRSLSASNSTDLGHALELEDSPVLALTAAAEAAASPGVLIIDQLDAVSAISGRNSRAFDLVERLIHEVRGTRVREKIHTVLVCRAFDWKNDSRLRRLIPDSSAQIEVTEFTVDEVKAIVANAGYDQELFQDRQLELLQLPQNLSLFVEAGFDPATAPAFGTATELFDRYWDEKRRRVEARAELSGDLWMEVVEILCHEMTFTQELSVPKEKLDRTSIRYLNVLASEGVITYDGHRYGFGHESFFDYCFARLSITRSESLVSFLLESEQHLFRRAQVRQVLVYLRDRDFTRYVKEVRNLLADERVRTHIKDLVFALLAEVTHPTEKEWKIWENWMTPALKAIEARTTNPDKLSAVAWERFFGSPSWFDFADEYGIIEAWLTSGSDQLSNAIVSYLRAHHRHSPDRVSALLEPYANGEGEWRQRSNFFMEWAELHTSRRLFDLFLRLLDNGTVDELSMGNSSFWSTLHNLAKHRPDWIPEVIAHQFRRRLAVIRAGDVSIVPNLFVGYDQVAVQTFHTSAEQAPAPFVEHVLPILLEISDSALRDEAPPKRDAVWLILVSGDELRGEYACLSALAKALATLARDGKNLSSEIAKLRFRDTHVANHLLLSLYRGGAEHYADEAVSLLCTETWRFQCGISDSPNWCAMKLIRAVVPHCHTSNLEMLETVILGYTPPFERTKSGYKRAGLSRFSLLSAIPSDQRSASTTRHFQELKRKFRQPLGEPFKLIAEMVGSPIEKTAAARMTDDQWLLAIAKYREDNLVSRFEDQLRGGASQLAQVLKDRVKENPERFARLSLKIPADSNPLYVEQILTALEKATIPDGLKLHVCRKAFADFREHCGRSIADVLGSIVDPLPGDALFMLHYLATEHQDPDRESWQENAGGGQPYYRGDIYTNGINTTRGRAVEAIRNLISNDVRYIDRCHATLERIIRDRSAAVLSCVAGTLRAVAHHNPVLATALFRRMALSEDRLLATRHVYGFIRNRLHDSFRKLRPVMVRMIRSSELEVCEAGARLAGIAGLIHPEASDLAEEALGGGARHRLGIAQVAVANIKYSDYRAWSKGMLTILFDDEDSDVRREAASCFRHVEDETLDTFNDLLMVFCYSRAFEKDLFWLFHKLEKMRERLPGTTCLVCERFLDRFADNDKDPETSRFGGSTHTVAKLIFRTYQQHQDDEWTSRLLDLIDRLCLERIFDARRELEEFDR